MEDRGGQEDAGGSRERNNEGVRSRWTPKPEQILILESIFNSGMVNPPKDETVRIRKLLEKFGSVGDANVFYWFQNRRSRSRRRQRQQIHEAAATTTSHATATATATATQQQQQQHGYYQTTNESSGGGGAIHQYEMSGSSSSSGGGGGSVDFVNEHLCSFSGEIGFPGYFSEQISSSPSVSAPLDTSSTSLPNQSPGFMTVFINGVPTEVGRGPIDMKGMFGEDLMLVHSSGMPVVPAFNDFGFSLHTLHHGESYFLVPRPG
ncbi:WUSCHEL-related homeobox 11-like [Rhododendron vialii]|uniref:WUSCHEL-related homeobox 11-like n=1 Tax=Rhododendron vialii TaxID=182163 RepID=UPI00265E25D5|nr:WUSCHEL-related homeobox 11-like [Rhododendron vialii]